MGFKFNLSLNILLFVACYDIGSVDGQRSLLHWKRDLEHRLASYASSRNIMNQILESSIYPTNSLINGDAIVPSNVNVRFSDLIIPQGSLIMESHIARPTIRVMVNKTQNYVNSKMIELTAHRNRLDGIRKYLFDKSEELIYKRLPRTLEPPVNYTKLGGTWFFKEFHYAHLIQSKQVDLKQIGLSNVDSVMREVYMENPDYGALLDSKSRLYFEGRKTFWNSVFQKPLTSGCCDRLRPLHTSRMMTRLAGQIVQAPIMFLTNDRYHIDPIRIGELTTPKMYNRILALGLMGIRLGYNAFQLIPSQPENLIELENLINFADPRTEIMKTITFADIVVIEEAHLSPLQNGRRQVIGVASNDNFSIDLSHNNYLLRYGNLSSRNSIQLVRGSLVVNGETHFVAGIEVDTVNRVHNFARFVKDEIVRIDRHAIINGRVLLDALPKMLNLAGINSKPVQNVQMMHVHPYLHVEWLNGMQFPKDVLLMPINLNATINIRGTRYFDNLVVMRNSVNVRQLINNIEMPAGIIPLDSDDFPGLDGGENLWFVDGIEAQNLVVLNGQFDEIQLNGVNDAQSLIVQSILSARPDGTQLIRAPLKITNLTVIGDRPETGLVNGFKPQYLTELSRLNLNGELPIMGTKTFLYPVEATECVFGEINNIANWTNYLIRIDRPKTIQTIHTKLAFVQPLHPIPINPATQILYRTGSSVMISRLNIEFYPNNSPAFYLDNLNFSPEFYILQQALIKAINNHTEGRYRVFNQVRLRNPNATINGVHLDDIVTLNNPFKFEDQFVLVGKVDVRGTLRANRIRSSYPIDVMDLEQFNRYRIPIIGSHGPIRLNHLALATNNQASFVQCQMLNGNLFNEFVNSIMSLTRPQTILGNLTFTAPTHFEGFVRTGSSLNSVRNFKQFVQKLKNVRYSFEDGMQCNSVLIRV